jgi:hypothetical protein
VVWVFDDVTYNLDADDSEPDPGIQPGLRRLHPHATITLDNQASHKYWCSKSTREIVDSLQPGGMEPLTAKQDGTVMQGNTRIPVLEERGFDINTLPRVPCP